MPGYCSSTPNASWVAAEHGASTTTSMPSGSARVRTTASVCGCTSSATRNVFDFDLPTRRHIVIASAAAVASSSIDAFAMSIAVRSDTIVWKLMIASRRPCEISG